MRCPKASQPLCQAAMIINCVNRAKLTNRLLHGPFGLHNWPPTPLKYFMRFLHLLSAVNYMYHRSQLCGHVTIQFARQWISLSDVTGYQTSLDIRRHWLSEMNIKMNEEQFCKIFAKSPASCVALSY